MNVGDKSATKVQPTGASGGGKLLRPRHASIGVKDDVFEHEDERVNPARKDGSASGAPGSKPSDPSNSA